MTDPTPQIPWRLPPELEPVRGFIHVDNGRTAEEAMNVAGKLDPGDPRRIDRQRVIAQVNIVRRLALAGWLRRPQPEPPTRSTP